MSGKEPSYAEFESLFVNNPKLGQVQAYLNRFNPIRTMKMERMEVRHSAILAWLMTPDETHGLGDAFLKAFLGEALRGQNVIQPDCSTKLPTALNIARADLSRASVRAEWRNIDIFVLCKEQNWAFIIENKFGAKQRRNQLSDYMDKVRRMFGDEIAVKGVFLTLADEVPENEGYAPIGYDAICTIIGSILEGGSSRVLVPEVQTFITHYLEVLKEATGMDDQRKSLESLARELYREHRRVLDFIIEHGGGTDLAIAARTLFGENADDQEVVVVDGQRFVYVGFGLDQVSFLPESWYKALGGENYEWSGCQNWWEAFPVISWFQLFPDQQGQSGKLRLYAEVGPISAHKVRAKLIQGIQKAAEKHDLKIGFQSGAADEGRRYSRFFRKNDVTVNEVNDSEELVNAMLKLLRNFKDEFAHVAPVLEFLTTTEIALKSTD